MQKNKRAFTLIELLVVVLIIGILAAVALPQYQKAVNKTQATEVLTAIDTLDKALASYYLEHGSYVGVTANTLDVNLPELKHFRYGVGCYFSQGSSMLTGWTPNINNAAGFEIFLAHSKGIAIKVTWVDGKLVRKHCSSTSEIEHPISCSDLFQCHQETVQIGTRSEPSACAI